MIQLPHIRDHMKNIGIDKSLSKSALFEHRYLKNMKILYQHTGKCDDQEQFKDIIEATMVYTTEGFIDNSPRYPTTTTPVNKPSARKLLCLFNDILYVKKLLSIKLELLNQSARKLKQEL